MSIKENISHCATLRDIIDKRKVSPVIMKLLQYDLVDIMILHDGVSSLSPLDIIVNESTSSISLRDSEHNDNILSAEDMMYQYGVLLHEVLESNKRKAPARLLRIASKCINMEYATIYDLQLELEKRISNTIYIPIIVFIIALMAILAWLNATSNS